MLIKYLIKLWLLRWFYALSMVALLAVPMARAEVSDEKWTGVGLNWTVFKHTEIARRQAFAYNRVGFCKTIRPDKIGWFYATTCRPELNPAYGDWFVNEFIWMPGNRSMTFKIDPSAYWPEWRVQNPAGAAAWDALPYPPVNPRALDLVFVDQFGYVCEHCPGWHPGRGGIPEAFLFNPALGF